MNEDFTYTYSAAQKQEIENIRKKYLPQEQDKMQQLRQLHRIPGKKARTWAITLGTLGALIMGSGMSIVMTELSRFFGPYATVIGICVGVLGMGLVALAYPVYNGVLKKHRERLAPQILALSDELLK